MLESTPSLLVLTLFAVAMLLSFIGGIWLIVEGFREHLLWGLAVLLIPFAALVFIFMKWSRAKGPFYLSLASFVLFVIGIFAIPKETFAGWSERVQALLEQAALAESSREELMFDEIAQQVEALKQQEAEILVRKQNLPPGDSAALEVLLADIEAYNAALKKLHAEPGYPLWKLKTESQK